jgi:hypothetical protein
MKKVLLLFVIMGGAISIAAQPGVYFVLKGGLNHSNFTHVEGDWVSGMNVGIGMDWQMSKRFGIETGLYYSEYGEKTVLEMVEIDYKRSYRMGITFLQIPLLAKYYVYKGLNVFAGPQAGYKLFISDSYHLGSPDFSFSGIAGVGYQFKFGLSLTANYVHGLTDLDPSYESYYIIGDENGETKYPYRYETQKIRISAFQFNIGWRF